MRESRRNTRQLEVIWDAVKHETCHPTADQIYEKVRKDLPSISLGTVYRNLQKLVRLGKLQVLSVGRSQHFDPLVKPHQHFICDQCNRVYDIFVDTRPLVPRKLPQEGFKVRSHQLAFYGTCTDCD